MSGEVVETHSIPHNDALALANNDRDLYIAGFPMGCYYVFDTVDGKITAKIDVPGDLPASFAPRDSRGRL